MLMILIRAAHSTIAIVLLTIFENKYASNTLCIAIVLVLVLERGTIITSYNSF
jgi:hypothetical protein